MIQYNNFLMKREQSRAGSRFAECEKSRLKAKILITLALLLTAVTGAWAQEPEITVNEVSPVTVPGATKQWTFEIPGSDVVLTPIYAPDAQFAIENAGTDNEKVLVPAPVEGLCAGSGEPIMTAGTTYEGTLYYTVTETDVIPAFSTTTWTTTLPTAEAFTTPCTVYGWAYIVGDDTHNDNGVFGPYPITLKRDLFDRVSAVLNNGSRVRLIMNEGKYQPIEPLTYTLTDISDAENPKTLVSGTDYTYGGMQMMNANNQWEDVTDESNLPPGIYRAQFYGMGDFAGWKPTDAVFELYYGYEVYVPAHEYVTYCSTEALTLEDENAALYTITAVSNSEATLSRALTVAPATTPLLVENNSDESRTILLIPTDKQADDVTPATEFIGVLTAERTLSKNDYFDYYAFNGLDFVYVVNPVDIPVGKCFIGIQTGNLSARSITIRRSATAIGATLVNSEEVNSEEWFDLNGRKVNKPTKKGIYIKNGQKVVIK